MGYSLCMLRAGGRALNGYYRDPYLLAISRELEAGVVEDKWFTGYETEPRRLPLVKSGTSLRCVVPGFELAAPQSTSIWKRSSPHAKTSAPLPAGWFPYRR